MVQTNAKHPTVQQLQAFGLGLSSPVEQNWIERHIEDCDACCRELARIPDDTLLGRLKSCDTSIDAADASGDADPRELDGSAVPEELADHPRYRIAGLVGRGGMGVVYQAEHRMMERVVAVKVVNRRLLSSRLAVDRFQLEVRAAARLHHPNIVTAFDAEQVGELHLLVMEFVDGVNLADYVAHHGPLPVEKACDIARQAAFGLQHAHEQGMVHRDIKPHNLMLTRAGTIKILDFGLARFASEAGTRESANAGHLTGSRAILGTPDYAAPEQLLDARTADIRADIYSLGCTLYFLLAGQPPFSGSALERLTGQLRQTPRLLSDVRQDVPVALADQVARLLAEAPEDRWPMPLDVAMALEPFCAEDRARAASPIAVSDDAPGAMANETEHGFPPTDARTAWPDDASAATVAGRPARGPSHAADVIRVTDAYRSKPHRSKPRQRAIASPQASRKNLLAVGTAVLVCYGALAVAGLKMVVFGGGESGSTPPVDTPAASPQLVEPSVAGPRVLLVVPHRNFWGQDVYPLRDGLEAAGVQVDIASSQSGEAFPNRRSSPIEYPRLAVDRLLSEANPEIYDAVVFTGSYPFDDQEFVHNERAAADAAAFIGEMVDRGKLVAAVCGGAAVPAHAGVLRGKRVAWTEYLPASLAAQAGLIKTFDEPITRDGQFITARHWNDVSQLLDALFLALDVDPARRETAA